MRSTRVLLTGGASCAVPFLCVLGMTPKVSSADVVVDLNGTQWSAQSCADAGPRSSVIQFSVNDLHVSADYHRTVRALLHLGAEGAPTLSVASQEDGTIRGTVLPAAQTGAAALPVLPGRAADGAHLMLTLSQDFRHLRIEETESGAFRLLTYCSGHAPGWKRSDEAATRRAVIALRDRDELQPLLGGWTTAAAEAQGHGCVHHLHRSYVLEVGMDDASVEVASERCGTDADNAASSPSVQRYEGDLAFLPDTSSLRVRRFEFSGKLVSCTGDGCPAPGQAWHKDLALTRSPVGACELHTLALRDSGRDLRLAPAGGSKAPGVAGQAATTTDACGPS